MIFYNFSCENALVLRSSFKIVINNLLFALSNYLNSTNNCILFENTQKKHIFKLHIFFIIGNLKTIGIININDNDLNSQVS